MMKRLYGCGTLCVLAFGRALRAVCIMGLFFMGGCWAPNTQDLFGPNEQRNYTKADPEVKTEDSDVGSIVSCKQVFQNPLVNLSKSNEKIQQQYQDIADCICHMDDPISDGQNHMLDHQYNIPEINYVCQLNLINEKMFQSLTENILTNELTSMDPVMIGRLNTCQTLVQDCQ